MNNIIVFNDSHEADVFTESVDKINDQLQSHNLKVSLNFIEDYVSPEGEFAYTVIINNLQEIKWWKSQTQVLGMKSNKAL